MPFRYKIALIFCLIFSTCSSYSAEIVPHKATYTAKIKKGISIKGNAVRELKQLKSGEWVYRFDVESFVADIEESVHFSWLDGKIKPRKYRYKLSPFLAKKRKNNYNFDWNKRSIKSTHKKKNWLIEDIPDNTYDRLGFQLQMIMDVQADKKDMYYEIVRKGELNLSHYQIIGKEVIDTKFGKLDSILVRKIRAKNKKRKTDMWFSADIPELLLKMVQIEKDGEKYEINLKSAVVNGKKAIFSKNTNIQ